MALNPGQTTLATIRNTAQSYSDTINDNFISPGEWLTWINNSYQELYDILITAYGNEYYFASPFLITSDGINDTFALPDGSGTAQAFYKLLGVDIQLTGAPGDPTGTYIPLKPFPMAERNRYNFPYLQAVYPGINRARYRLRQNSLWLQPLPKSAQTFRVWYAPRLTPLVSDVDIVDGVSGWEDFIQVDAAIKAKGKREEESPDLNQRKKELLARIEIAAENRDQNGPQVVSDTRYGNSFVTPSGFFDNDYY